MRFIERLKGLFKKRETERSTFAITFRHSAKSIEFEGTWEEVKGLFGKFAGGKGLKMGNFFVPWDEVAFIYQEDKEEKKGEAKKGPKPGDEIPATPEAKDLGAETMEVLGEKESPKDARIDEVKAAVEKETEVKAEEIK